MELLSRIRTVFLDEHRALRQRVHDLQVDLGDATHAARAQAAALDLLDELQAHLAHEDAELLPALETADAWGDERARAMKEDHAAQWTEMRRLRDRLSRGSLPLADLRPLLLSFCDTLLKDMDGEEHDRLDAALLRDDPVVITQTDG